MGSSGKVSYSCCWTINKAGMMHGRSCRGVLWEVKSSCNFPGSGDDDGVADVKWAQQKEGTPLDATQEYLLDLIIIYFIRVLVATQFLLKVNRGCLQCRRLVKAHFLHLVFKFISRPLTGWVSTDFGSCDVQSPGKTIISLSATHLPSLSSPR